MNDELKTELYVVETQALRKTYSSGDSPVVALRGVDLSLQKGEFVALRGPSGSGKSTLLHLIAGLATPTDGDVLVAGRSLTAMDANDRAKMRRRHIGMVFQFFNLLESMTVFENVLLPALLARPGRREAEERARSVLDLLGLAHRGKEAPAVLSGGQRQRLAIARALANDPTVLLADEPTGALDSSSGQEVLDLFRQLHESRGLSILLATHDETVAAAASRTILLRDGRIVDGTVERAPT